MGFLARTEQVANFLQRETVRSKVGDELTILSVIAEHPTLLYCGNTSDTVQDVVIKSVAVAQVTGDSPEMLAKKMIGWS